jgi:hypothetical protein
MPITQKLEDEDAGKTSNDHLDPTTIAARYYEKSQKTVVNNITTSSKNTHFLSRRKKKTKQYMALCDARLSGYRS